MTKGGWEFGLGLGYCVIALGFGDHFGTAPYFHPEKIQGRKRRSR